MSDTPRYSTLRDYLRVLSKQRWLILGITAIFTLAAYGVSSLQTTKYTAETSLSFREIGQDLTFLGQESLPELAPDQRANINAERLRRSDIARRVQKALKTDLTVEEVQNSIETEVGSRTNLVIIQVTDTSPEFAARLANKYADQVQTLDTGEVRDRVDQAIDSLRSGLRDVGDGVDAGTAAFSEATLRQQISQLETLREFVEPVQITTRAEVPDEPSSPKPLRNTALGFLVGLTFGLVAAFLRDTLDRRLRKSDDVQAALQLPVVGRVPEDALGEAGFARNGRHRPEEIEEQLEAFRVLRTNLEFLHSEGPMRSVLVTSGLPEEGKSTVAMALAGAAAVAGKRVLLVECDLRRPCMADRLGLERSPGLSDYLVGKAEPKDVLQMVELTTPGDTNGARPQNGEESIGGAWMVCITAGSSAPLPAELLGSVRFEQFLDKVTNAYDLVVLDTSPILPVVDALELVPQVDGMLFCVRLSRTTRDEARAATDALNHLPKRPTGLVVTGIRPGDDAYGYYYGAYSSYEDS